MSAAARLIHPIPILILLIAIFDCACAALWLAGVARGGILDHLTGAAALPGGLILVYIGVRLRFSDRLEARDRRAWLLVSLGVTVYGLGYGCIAMGGALGFAPFRVVGIGLEMATYPLVGVGLASLARSYERTSDSLLLWLDVCIVAWSTTILVWHYAFFPVAREMHASIASTFITAFPPVGDLSLMFATGAVLLRGLRSSSQRALLIGGISLLCLFCGDVIAGTEQLRDSYSIGGLSGIFYGFAWLGLVAGAHTQLAHPAGSVPRDLSRYRRIGQWFPYAAAFLAFVGPPLYHWNDLEMMQQHIPATGFLMALLTARLLVTAHQNASHASAERTRLAAAVEQAAEVVVTTDRAWRIAYANAALTRMTGYKLSEVIGQDLSVIRGASPEDRLSEMRAAVDRGDSWHGRFTQVRRDGSSVEIDMAVAPLREGGDPAGAVVLARDITRERALESQLAQTQRMEAVGRLAGGIAHDFNNILTAISGFSELAASSLPADHPASSDLREVLKASDRAADLTRDLLAFGRRQVMQPRLLDLNAVIEGMRSMLERTLGEDIALLFRAQSGLGLTLADQSQVEQVVLNLAVNARDAMPDGGMLTVTTANADFDEAYARTHAGTRAGQFVSLTVADTGKGLAPDVLEHVFEPFYATGTRGRTTGLGLSTVAGIVEQSGGFVTADSSVGSGSVFSVFLPRVVSTERVEDPGEAEERISGGNETILVAEDEAPVRRVIERVLRTAGYRVFVAANGHEALAMAPTLPHLDLLLTDVVMPGMNGVELARQLCRARSDLRVLFASGYSGDSLIRIGARGSVPYLDKPFTAETLLTRVRDVLDAPVARYFD